MHTVALTGDHRSVRPPDKTASAPTRRPADWKSVEDSLASLARAVQQFHTYPSSSPLCVQAIDSCQRTLASLTVRDHLALRVAPSELFVDDIPIGSGGPVGQWLAKRLHKASVAAIAIDRSVTPRELSRFCEDLIRCGESSEAGLTLLDALIEHGIERITVEPAGRPAVLEAHAPAREVLEAVRREHARFDAQMARGGPIGHLYPPQKGWVRLDPGCQLPAVSLLDLAILAGDPAALASMLVHLTNDEAAAVPPSAALEEKYGDVAMLIAALDPRIGRPLFARLARAVLDLDPDVRQALLRRTVLPGLLDGRVDGAILHEFPDVDLSEALSLLLDLETAAPELLATALSRLDLSPERRAAVVPLLDVHLKAREAAALEEDRHTTLARHARDLVRIDPVAGKTFSEFAAFDLSVDRRTSQALEHIREAVPSTDVLASQLTCLWHLICLQPNPEAATRFFSRVFDLFDALEHGGRSVELPGWLARYRALADRLRETRPDVSAAIESRLAAFCTPARAAWIADLALREPDGRRAAATLISAVGCAIAPPLVGVLEGAPADGGGTPDQRQRARSAAQLLVDHAPLLAPALAPLVAECSAPVRRTLLRVLGSAGRGHERSIAFWISAHDEPTAREALRALALAGTAEAASIVAGEIEKQAGALGIAAEEALWHFPAAEAQRQTRNLLGRREFTTHHARACERLLERVARAGCRDLDPVLHELAPLRFRIWNPALARVARKAHAMLGKR